MESNSGSAKIRAIGEYFEDSFTLESTEKDAYLDALRSFGAERTTRLIPVKELRFRPMPDPLLMAGLRGADDRMVAITYDSHQSGTQVYVDDSGSPLMLRSTALISIFERLGIGGQALGRLSAEKLAIHLNDYADVAPGEGLAIVNNGKLEAVMSKNYRLVPSENVMEVAAEFFADEGANFIKGSISHQFAVSEWFMGVRKIEIPINTGLSEVEFVQSAVVRTSDCGFSGINTFPLMRTQGDRFGLRYSMPIKMDHVGDTDLEKFRRGLKLISKQFDTAEQTVRKLADTYLYYPVNVLIALLKWLKIPAKYGVPVYEKKKGQWGENSRTAYDVYSSLSEVLSLMMAEEKSLTNLAEYQERFARGLGFSFEVYDLQGDYSYTDKLIGLKGA